MNETLATPAPATEVDLGGNVQPFSVYEEAIFRFALEATNGCVSRAATLLKVGRATMYRKMRTYSIDVAATRR